MMQHDIDLPSRKCRACGVPSWLVDDRLVSDECGGRACGCRPQVIAAAVRNGCTNVTCPHVSKP